MDVPKCPSHWTELWIGYSFVMVQNVLEFNYCVTDIQLLRTVIDAIDVCFYCSTQMQGPKAAASL